MNNLEISTNEVKDSGTSSLDVDNMYKEKSRLIEERSRNKNAIR